MMHEETPALLLVLKCKLDYIEEVPAGLIMPTYLLEKIYNFLLIREY